MAKKSHHRILAGIYNEPGWLWLARLSRNSLHQSPAYKMVHIDRIHQSGGLDASIYIYRTLPPTHGLNIGPTMTAHIPAHLPIQPPADLLTQPSLHELCSTNDPSTGPLTSPTTGPCTGPIVTSLSTRLAHALAQPPGKSLFRMVSHLLLQRPTHPLAQSPTQ